MASTGAAAGAAAVRQARPKIDYQLPAGWEPSPNGPLSLASFRVTGGRTNGPGAEVSITPLGQLAGKEFALVNLWREQVGQPAITEADLPFHAYDVWHDRAVFHFLTSPEERQAYVQAVLRAVKPGGHVIEIGRAHV